MRAVSHDVCAVLMNLDALASAIVKKYASRISATILTVLGKSLD